MLTVSKQQAANYLLAHAGLNSNRNLQQVLQDLSCIQVDPVNVVSRSHELALYNRINGFQKDDLYKALYQDHSLFEYWLQLYSIIPVSAFPYLKAIREAPANWHHNMQDDWQGAYQKQHQQEIAAVLAFIAAKGPTTAKDLSHLPKGAPILSWKGENSQKALLEFLWSTGQVQICSRGANAKYYDLTERVIPKAVLDVKVDAQAGYQFLVDSHFKYAGLVRAMALVRSGRGRLAGARAEFARQLKAEQIVELKIEGSATKYFIKQQELEQLQTAGAGLHQTLNILPPLDPLIIDRQLLLDAFGFFYRWEGYTPLAKRKYGYYNMPILYQGRFIGQVDLAKTTSKTSKQLLVKGLHLDEKSKQISQALEVELSRLEDFCF